MPPRQIKSWNFDEWNLAELAEHGITRRTVRQVAEESPRFRANKRNRAASHHMIGPDRGGAFWVICIVELPDQDHEWRAITGWAARQHEREWYRRSK
jgi:hypothetical protein